MEQNSMSSPSGMFRNNGNGNIQVRIHWADTFFWTFRGKRPFSQKAGEPTATCQNVFERCSTVPLISTLPLWILNNSPLFPWLNNKCRICDLVRHCLHWGSKCQLLQRCFTLTQKPIHRKDDIQRPVLKLDPLRPFPSKQAFLFPAATAFSTLEVAL